MMKKPRLFYYAEGVDAWIPVPDLVEGELVCTADEMEDGEQMEMRFKRIDMTDEEFACLPEG